MQQDQPYLIFVYRYFACLILLLSVVSFSVSPVEVVLAINGIHTPFLDFAFLLLTNLGNGLILIPFILILSLRSIYLSIGLLASGIIEGIIVLFCKRLLFPSAGRPSTLLDPSMIHFIPGLEIHKSMSFPSGHTVTIFGLCIYLALCYRNNAISLVLAIIAALVGISRVYLLQHFITDIVGGAIIGSVTGVFVYQWIEQLNKPAWMNQRLEIKLKITNSKPRFS